MTKNHNDNIICRFFEKTAALWRKAAEYQVFIMLATVALLAILLFFQTESSSNAQIVINIIIFCAAAFGIFMFFKLKMNGLAAFTFVTALLLRICLVFIIESSTPVMLDDIRTKELPWRQYYNTMLFAGDEFFYVYSAQRYNDVTISEFINSPQLIYNEERVGFLISRIFRLFGEEFIWNRIVGAFLGAFAAAMIYLTAREFFDKNISAIISLFSALAPQTAIYSVRFLKEMWTFFAVSLIIFGFAMIIRNKKLLLTILLIAAGSAILMWIRFEYALMFIAAVPIVICFRAKGDPVKRIFAIIAVIILGAIIFIWQFDRMTIKAERLLDKYTVTEEAQSGRLEILDRIYKSRGPLRLLNIPLAALNPPPKNLQHLFMPENGFFDIILQADIWQWWLGLPFLIIGSVIIIDKRTEFLAFLATYYVAIIISALLIGGLMPGVYRYRDSLAPIAFIIIGTGLESFMTAKKLWKNSVIISTYALFVILAVYFYMI